MTDVSSEDTPLSIRQISIAESRRKRLTLYNTGVASGEANHLNSTEESQEEERDSKQYSVGESENEKHDEHQDGVRRSQRTRKLINASYNESWIFGEKTAKVEKIYTV